MLTQLAINYSSNYNFTTSSKPGTGFLVALLLLALIAYALLAVGLWKVFMKAGRKGWPAIIPIYNTWVLFEISGKPGWWALVGLLGSIPIIGIVAGIAAIVLYVIAMLELAKRFHKSTTFAIFGMMIFNIIGFLILGFGKDKYRSKVNSPARSE